LFVEVRKLLVENSYFMNNHGGKRQNSGRRLRPETVTLSFRVPKEQATNLKKEIKEFIQRYELWRKLNG